MTRRHTLLALPALTASVLLAATGCDGGGSGNDWTGTIDTLASGAILVDNTGQGVWREGDGWTVHETLRIGSAMDEGPALFGSITGIAVDSAGRIHVLDRQVKELRTFGPDGAHIRTVGREGGGPGEFRDPLGLAVTPAGDAIIATDAGNNRYARFDTAGRYLGGHVRGLGGYSLPWTGGFDVDGRFHERLPAGVVRLDTAFQPADTLRYPDYDAPTFELTMERGRIATAVPFASRQLTGWDARGYLWTAVTGDYTITRLAPTGDTLQVIRRTGLPRVPVGAEEREDALEGMEWFTRQGGRIDPSRIPSEKPFITSFHVAGDGHIWARRTPAEEEEQPLYDVFDPEGRYLGEVTVPDPLRIPIFRGDAIYSVTADSLGVQYVVRYRVERP